MLMPRKGTVTRCKFVACNKVAPYYYWPTFYRSFARCRSPLRPTTCPFDIRGVVFPAPYAFLPKVTGRPWQHGHPDTRLTRLPSRSPTDRPRYQTRKTPSFLQFTPYCCQKTMPLWSSIFQVPFFTRINIGTIAFFAAAHHLLNMLHSTARSGGNIDQLCHYLKTRLLLYLPTQITCKR
jgi:hypothetical protein